VPQRKLKVIYIAGYGRSGTTLLDIALGQQPGVFAAGEVTALPRHVWKNREFCACHQRADACAFWGPMVRSWLKDRPAGAMEGYGRRLARSEWLVDPRRWFWRFGLSRNARAYREETSDLFGKIAETSGASTIVDSSKLPGRASVLMSIGNIELYVVHVVRDGRGVCWSMMKPYKRSVEAGLQKETRPKSLWQTAFRWFTVNLGAEIVRLRLPRKRSMRVRYEDFVVDPAATVKSIMQLVGIDYTAPRHGADVIKPQHQIAGNRRRMDEEIVISKDIGWTANMPRAAQSMFGALTAPLLLRYGYLRSPPHQPSRGRSSDRKIVEEVT
jgi:hypothetical protein